MNAKTLEEQGEEIAKICVAINNDFASIKSDLEEIKKLLGSPAYIIEQGNLPNSAYDELKKAICRPLRPGSITPLSSEAFELYQKMLPCPPRR